MPNRYNYIGILLMTVLIALNGYAQCDPMPVITGDTLLCPNSSGELMTQEFDSYQWYKRGYSDTVSTPIDGANSQSLAITAEEHTLSYISVEVTEDTCTSRSPEVLVDSYVFLLPVVRSSGDFEIGDNGSSILCEGDTMYFTLLPPYDTAITWFKDGAVLPDENDTTLIVTEEGSYSVEGAPSICPNYIRRLGVSLVVEEEDCMTANKNPVPSTIRIYPNPAHSVLKIENSGLYSIDDAQLLDFSGKIVQKVQLHRGKQEVDVSSFPPGVYYLKFTDAEQAFGVKFIIQ